MKLSFALIAVVFLVATACPTSPGTVDITGNWTYSATFQDTLPQVSCATTSGTMTLTQTSASAVGTYSALNFTCTGAVNGSFGPYNGVIPGGTVAGGTVVFTFDVDACCGGPGSQWQNQGHASNSSMSGSMVAVVTLNGTQYSLYGLWQANKQ